jgi:hypothetical protein
MRFTSDPDPRISPIRASNALPPHSATSIGA